MRRVIERVLAVTDEPIQFQREDVEYVIDSGLIRRVPNGGLTIANPIYQEIILR